MERVALWFKVLSSSQNQKGSGSKRKRWSVGIRDPTLVQLLVQLTFGLKTDKMQWLTSGKRGYPLENGLKLTVEPPNSRSKKNRIIWFGKLLCKLNGFENTFHIHMSLDAVTNILSKKITCIGRGIPQVHENKMSKF